MTRHDVISARDKKPYVIPHVLHEKEMGMDSGIQGWH